MWKFGILLVLVSVLAGANIAHAAEFRHQELVTVGPDEVIREDVYATGERVNVDGRIEGDLVVAAGNVEVTGTVTGDVIAAGGEVVLRGTVGDDVRVAGGDVTIDGTVNGHAVLAGGQLDIRSIANVQGDVRIAAGQVTLAGDTGALMVHAGKFIVADTAHIRGDLTYGVGKSVAIAEGATIDGTTQEKVFPMKKDKAAGIAAFVALFSLASLIGSFIVGLLLLRYLPNKSRTIATQWRVQFGKNLLWGILIVFLTPVLGGLLIATLVGAPLGIGLFLLYPVLFYLGYVFGALAVGQWLRGKMAPAERRLDWVTLLLGLVVLLVVGLIPIIGDLVVCIVILASIGALVRFDWNLGKRLRADGTV